MGAMNYWWMHGCLTNDEIHFLNDGCCAIVAMSVCWELGWREFPPVSANVEEQSFLAEGQQEFAIQNADLGDDQSSALDGIEQLPG